MGPPEQGTLPASVADLSAYCFESPHSPDALFFTAGQGLRLNDSKGDVYLDGLSGVFVTCFGYDCRPIVEAVTDQLGRLPFSPPLHGANQPAIALAQELLCLAPEGFASVKLVNGGSESVEAAVRIARYYHRERGHAGKYKILSYYHSYHGSTFGSLTVTGRPDTGRFGPGMHGVSHVWHPDSLETFLGVSPNEAGPIALTLIERTIQAEGPDSIAALVVEPVIHLLGMAVPPPDFLPGLRVLCDRYNITLIFDEIVTGFGRTGRAFAAQTYQAVPDIICMGKGLSGGYAPLAAVLIGERIAPVLDTGDGTRSFAPSHTYAANPVSAAAGLAAVRLYHELDVERRVADLAEHLGPRLREVIGDRGQVRGTGLLYGVRLTRPPSGAVVGPGLAVAQAALRRGLIIRGEDDWFVLAPAFVAQPDDLEELVETVGAALDEVFGGDR
ncbi:aminotransferase family protein [Streptomyces scopuliridis]|uniref:aminotransferase family protein n=1 Tax=Streptomyces scopuliridis TaxID=452529 RepID=UPI003422D5F6